MAPSQTTRVGNRAGRSIYCAAILWARPQNRNGSRVLLVFALATDDIGDVVAFVFVGLEERVIGGCIIGHLDFLFVSLDRHLLALGLGIGLFERHEFDFGGLRNFHF